MYLIHQRFIALFPLFTALLNYLHYMIFTSTDQSLKKDLIVERILTTSVGFTYIGLKEIRPFGSLSNSNKD